MLSYCAIIIYISKKLLPTNGIKITLRIRISYQLINVNSRGEYFTFIWDDSEESARLSSKKTGEKIKFRWIDDNKKDTDYFFELRILEDEITKDVSLMIVDFALEDELDEAKLLWENQISDLKHVIGSV